MVSALPFVVLWPVMACFIALPALAALHRRRASREVSAVATELAAFATTLREAQSRLPMDATLLARILRLRVADTTPLQLAQALDRGEPVLLADVVQRLASRLRRRVAFERMMLARTAPGLRRGAIAASLPPLLVGVVSWSGAHVPLAAQVSLLCIEAVGCVLLWRLARVEI